MLTKYSFCINVIRSRSCIRSYGQLAFSSSAAAHPKMSVHEVSREAGAMRKAITFTSGATEYDVLIIGGGVTGSALLYELAKFTVKADIKKIGLFERRSDFARVASGPNNNSQTIHCGDIETNYTLDKAKSVKRYADMLRNYGLQLPAEVRDKCIYKMQKMVLGVGEDECFQIEERFKVFKEVFTKMELVNKTQLRDIEPNVVRITNHRDRHEIVNAIVVKNEHSAVNYYNLTHSFIKQAEMADVDKTIDVRNNTEVQDINLNSDDTYTVKTSSGNVNAKFVVVSACGYSLLMAQKLGYGLHYSCLPVAGSFYFSKLPVLIGKVYTIQDPKLPFAAVHGDPDVDAGNNLSRFGPTALPLPLLERYNMKSFPDFLKVCNFDLKLLDVFRRLFSDGTMWRFALKNFIFELPYFGLNRFLQDARKIVPGLTRDSLVYAHGYGGIRPQLVDKKLMKLIMGEGKIQGLNIVFNVTPSPGGTTCLGNGETDMRLICNRLGANINEDLFRRILLEGEYRVD